MSVNKPIFIARCPFYAAADGVDTTQSCIFCGFCLSMLMYRVRERETEWEICLSLADARPACWRPCPQGAKPRVNQREGRHKDYNAGSFSFVARLL